MSKKKALEKFEEEMIVNHNDRILNAAYEFLNLIHNPSGNKEYDLPDTSQFICNFMDMVEEFLINPTVNMIGKFDICYPYHIPDMDYEDSENGLPCIYDPECKNPACPMHHTLEDDE